MAERRAVVKFEVQGDQAARQALSRMADDTERANKRGEESAKKMGAALGVALAAGATGAALMIKRAIDSADALDNMSQRTGVSVEALSRLEVAAKLSDTSLESLQKAMGRLASQQLEAAKGGKDQLALFKAFGLSIEELDQLSPDQVLKRLSDGFAQMGDGADAASLASKLFGKGLGEELLPFLLQGSERLQEFDDKADALGVTLSGPAAAAAARFNDELDLIKLGIMGVFRSASIDLVPALTELAAKFNDPAFRDGINSIITGATTAVIKLVELTGALGSVTKFAGEELASAFNGPGIQDIVRTEEQLGRVEATLSRLKAGGDVTAAFEVLSPNRVGIDFRDLLSTREDVIAKLEAQKKQLNESLKIGYALDAEDRAAPPPAPKPESQDSDAMKEYLRLLKEQSEAEAAAAAGRIAASAAARERAEAERELQRAMEEQRQASEEFQMSLEDMRAAMAGPVAQAYLDYQREVRRLVDLHERGKVSQEDLTEALELATRAREKNVEAIQAQLTPAQRVLEQIEEEIKLLGMGTLAREKYLARQAMGPKATTEEQAKSDELIIERDQLERTIDALDAVRTAGSDIFMDWASGSKGFWDSIEDGLDNLQQRLLQMVADNLMEKLLGGFGSSETGSAGAGIAGFIGKLFGSEKGNAFTQGSAIEAFSAGGIPDGPRLFPMAQGRWGVMNEGLDKEAILPLKRGADGRLGVHASGGGQAAPLTIQFNMPGRYDQRTQSQIAADVYREQRRAIGRGNA